MSEETTEVTEVKKTHEFPYKEVFAALAAGIVISGAAYALSRKVTVESDDSDDTETPEA